MSTLQTEAFRPVLRKFSSDVHNILKRDGQSLRTGSALFGRLHTSLEQFCQSSTSRFSLEHEEEVSKTLNDFGDKLLKPSGTDAMPNVGFQSLGTWCQRFADLISKMVAARDNFNQTIIDMILPALHTVKSIADTSITSSDSYLVSSNFMSLEDLSKAKAVSKSGCQSLGQHGVDEVKRTESRSARCIDSSFQALSDLGSCYNLLYGSYATEIEALLAEFEEFRAAFLYPPIASTLEENLTDLAKQIEASNNAPQPSSSSSSSSSSSAASSSSLAATPSPPFPLRQGIKPLPAKPTDRTSVSPTPSSSSSPTHHSHSQSPSPTHSRLLGSLPSEDFDYADADGDRTRATSMTFPKSPVASVPPLVSSSSASALPRFPMALSSASSSSSSSSSASSSSPPASPLGLHRGSSYGAAPLGDEQRDEEFFKNKSRSKALDAPSRVLSQRRRLLLGNFISTESRVINALTFAKNELLEELLNDKTSKAANRLDLADRTNLNGLVVGLLHFHTNIVAESQRLMESWTEQSSVGQLFQSFQVAKHHEKYFDQIPELLDMLDRARKDSKVFNTFCRKVEEIGAPQGYPTLRALLYDIPVSIVPQYENLMAQSNDQTRADDPNRQVLLNAFIEFSKLEGIRADSLRRYEQRKVVQRTAKLLTNLPPDLVLASRHRAFVKEGPGFAVDAGDKRKPVQLFVFSDLLIEATRQKRVVSGTTFQYARMFDLTHCGVEVPACDPDPTRWNLVLPPSGEGFDHERVLFASVDAESRSAWVQTMQSTARFWENNRAFAVPLRTLMKSPHNHLHDIPTVVSALIAHIIAHGLRTEGIFRMSGAKREVDRIRREFDVTGAANLSNADIHSVAVVLKHWLRELPDQLVPTAVQDEMLACISVDSVQEQIGIVRQALSHMAQLSQYLLQHIISFIALIAAHQDQNKMTIPNLAIVFAPSIIQREFTSAEQQDLVFKLFHLLVTNYDEIFGEIERARRLEREKVIASESFLMTT